MLQGLRVAAGLAAAGFTSWSETHGHLVCRRSDRRRGPAAGPRAEQVLEVQAQDVGDIVERQVPQVRALDPVGCRPGARGMPLPPAAVGVAES